MEVGAREQLRTVEFKVPELAMLLQVRSSPPKEPRLALVRKPTSTYQTHVGRCGGHLPYSNFPVVKDTCKSQP